jgi:hypothetical protein
MNLHKSLTGAFMSLTRQTISVMTHNCNQLTCTLPAEHVYPFIIHRSVREWKEKQNGERTRYSNKHIVTHLLSGCQLGVFPNYENALTFVRKLKNKPIWLMPTYDLIVNHPDKMEISVLVKRLKSKLGMEELG